MQAIGFWSITTLLARVIDPARNGRLSGNFSWSSNFFISPPLKLFYTALAWDFLMRYDAVSNGHRP